MSENDTPRTEVTLLPEESRYVLSVDGTQVGFAAFTDRGGQRVFTHTVIDPSQEGNGYGSTLIKGALEQVREAGLEAVPVCPFVERYVSKHHEFDDILAPASVELRDSL